MKRNYLATLAVAHSLALSCERFHNVQRSGCCRQLVTDQMSGFYVKTRPKISTTKHSTPHKLPVIVLGSTIACVYAVIRLCVTAVAQRQGKWPSLWRTATSGTGWLSSSYLVSVMKGSIKSNTLAVARHRAVRIKAALLQMLQEIRIHSL